MVIPVYNQIHYTYACLVSILQNTPDVSYEIIIADDVSTDATRELSRYAENVVICQPGLFKKLQQCGEKGPGKIYHVLK